MGFTLASPKWFRPRGAADAHALRSIASCGEDEVEGLGRVFMFSVWGLYAKCKDPCVLSIILTVLFVIVISLLK